MLYGAENKGRDLEQTINNIVTEYGWVESVATAILNRLEDALKEGIPMGQVMRGV